MWVGIWIDLAIPLGRRLDCLRDLVHLYITRSTNAGLNLCIEATHMDRKYNRIAYAASAFWSRTIVQLLLLERSRWRHFAINLAEDINVFDYLQGLTGSYDGLEKLELGEGVDYRPSETPGQYHYDVTVLDGLASDSPNLRELHISGSYFEHLESMPFKFQQLTSVIVNGSSCYDWGQIVHMLQAFPSLERCSIDFGCTFPETDEELEDSLFPVPHSRLTTLKSLTMTMGSLYMASTVMLTLILPSLTDLNLTFDSFWEFPAEFQCLQNPSPSNDRMFGLKMMLQESSCPLQSLKLTCGDLFSTKEISDLLSLLPSLISLSLDAACDMLSTKFFVGLTASQGAFKPTLVPHLTSLDISLADLYSRTSALPDPETILSMIKSRQSGTDVLSHFGLTAPARAAVESEKEWGQSLREMMRIRLRGYREQSRTQRKLTHILDLGEL
ncbi:hypothetical protein D9758_006141 [Tetrapyrgos nigripes]|uniref:Uncharacterized protein n=1 Tax=Tetrapyrgos nigripes TaxID=182062 RepID=A0A8H5GAL1_9AGAR|nr:hypothetical protein D9758_006141 [Tetrapyrgos nigripes]